MSGTQPTHSNVGANTVAQRTIVVVCEDDANRGRLACRVFDCFPEGDDGQTIVPKIVRAFNPTMAQQAVERLEDPVVIVQDEVRSNSQGLPVGLESVRALAEKLLEKPGSRFAVVTNDPTTPSWKTLASDFPNAMILGSQDSFRPVVR